MTLAEPEVCLSWICTHLVVVSVDILHNPTLPKQRKNEKCVILCQIIQKSRYQTELHN